MHPAIARQFIVLALVLMMSASCNRARSASSVPASVAYSDGFEVVVFELHDGVPTHVRSIPLKEAEQAIAAGSQALIPGDASAIQRQLSTGKVGDSHAIVSVQKLNSGKQQIRVQFHDSLRTFVYEYMSMALTCS